MTIKDLYEQRAGIWHNVAITYVTIGDAVPTKPDQNQFDSMKQLVYFMDESGVHCEMTVYVPDTPNGLEPIPENLTGEKAVFRIKQKDGHLTGTLTDKIPDETPSTEDKWDKINLGKCRHGILCAYIQNNGLPVVVSDMHPPKIIGLNSFTLEIINQLAEFSMTGQTGD